MGYRKIVYSEASIRDLAAIRDYYWNRSGRDVAIKVIRDIRDYIRRLKTSPFIGSPLPNSKARALHHSPFLIFYKVDESNNVIYLISIPHGSQLEGRMVGAMPFFELQYLHLWSLFLIITSGLGFMVHLN